jgi:hypothetical protein
MKRIFQNCIIASAVLLLIGCGDSKQYETAICALIDVSGTYAHEKPNVARIIKAGIVSNIEPGDSVFIITIDENSYTEEDLVAKLTLDYIPSKANEQKLAFGKKIDEFSKTNKRAPFTDISGAMMLCGDRLRDTGSGNLAMMIFSDMKEELAPGLKRNFKDTEFSGIDFSALNVIKLNPDSRDPEIHRERLHAWEEKLKKSGAQSWEIILDAQEVPEYLEKLKS